MEFEPQSLVAAIQSGAPWPIAGVVLLFVVALFRSSVETRLGEKTRELTSAAAGGLVVLGTAWAAGVVWWEGLAVCLAGALMSSGFYRLVFARLIPAGFGGILLALLLLACPVEVGPEDRGLMVREGTGGELVELHAAAYPVPVSADPELADEVQRAIDWWGDQARGEPWAEWTDGVGLVHVFAGEVAPDYGGRADITYDRATGAIVEADVFVEPGWSRPEHLRHELGHGVLGLDDDGPSVDLGSIMSSPVLPDATLTAADRAAVERWRS